MRTEIRVLAPFADYTERLTACRFRLTRENDTQLVDLKGCGVAREAHIVGAGIGGLAVAAILAKTDWKVVVHERASMLREVGAGIFLKENGLQVLEELGPLEDLIDKGTRLRKSNLKDANGRSLLARDISAERVYTVLRADLHQHLTTLAAKWGVEVQTSADIVDVQPDGRLSTADGHDYKADLIIGADGLNSITRRKMGLEVSCVMLPNGSSRMLVPQTDGDLKDESVEQWVGHKRVLAVPVGKSLVYLCASAKESDVRGVQLPFDVGYWGKLFPAYAEQFSRVDPSTVIHHRHGLVHVNAWSKGKVAILGDAVHGQPPNLGQGAGLSISNAGSLAHILEAERDVPRALAAWEAKERRLTEQVQNWSENWDHFVHKWPVGVERLRSVVIWGLANAPATRRHWGKLYRGLNQPVGVAAASPNKAGSSNRLTASN
jgi:2-polyprenyl-6-methoxyphenol hydroxylase-like FAD-dependent oxidoreductase